MQCDAVSLIAGENYVPCEKKKKKKFLLMHESWLAKTGHFLVSWGSSSFVPRFRD